MSQTLDAADMAYRPNYSRQGCLAMYFALGVFNSHLTFSAEDGTDRSTAKGWNYHQGPGNPPAPHPPPPAPHSTSRLPLPTEWLWPTGYFLRAYALLHTESHAAAARLFVLQRLAALTTGACRSRHGVIPRLTLRY